MSDLFHEEWRAIPGYEGIFEASNLGRIRSLARTVPAGRGYAPKHFPCRILSQKKLLKGYPMVTLCYGARKRGAQVHVLVCSAFHGCKPTDKHQVAHADGNRLNARADNLRWATRAENEADKLRHGTRSRGERHGGAKLTDRQAASILRFVGPHTEVADNFNVSEATVRRIRAGRGWRHVAGVPA